MGPTCILGGLAETKVECMGHIAIVTDGPTPPRFKRRGHIYWSMEGRFALTLTSVFACSMRNKFFLPAPSTPDATWEAKQTGTRKPPKATEVSIHPHCRHQATSEARSIRMGSRFICLRCASHVASSVDEALNLRQKMSRKNTRIIRKQG